MKMRIKVKPNSSEQKITLLEENNYRIELKSHADKNKANLELVRLLSKHFEVPAKSIVIKAGLTGRDKLIEVKNEI